MKKDPRRKPGSFCALEFNFGDDHVVVGEGFDEFGARRGAFFDEDIVEFLTVVSGALVDSFIVVLGQIWHQIKESLGVEVAGDSIWGESGDFVIKLRENCRIGLWSGVEAAEWEVVVVEQGDFLLAKFDRNGLVPLIEGVIGVARAGGLGEHRVREKLFGTFRKWIFREDSDATTSILESVARAEFESGGIF